MPKAFQVIMSVWGKTPLMSWLQPNEERSHVVESLNAAYQKKNETEQYESLIGPAIGEASSPSGSAYAGVGV